MKNNVKNKDLNKKPAISTKISLVGKIAYKVGVNKRFHKYDDDSWESNNNFIISPVDAKLVACGHIKDGGKIVSKANKEISLEEILPGSSSLFDGGFYFNFYLSPKNRHYWRIPCDGVLNSVSLNNGKAKVPIFIGLEKVFKKKDFFQKAVKKNASIGMIFKNNNFNFAMIPVGSLNVNGIHIIEGENGYYKKGDIGGYFSIGSSMLLCFPKNIFKSLINVGDKVKIGQNIIKLN